jgi:hypothetical protein
MFESNSIRIIPLSERKKLPIILAIFIAIFATILCSAFINFRNPTVSNFTVTNADTNKEYPSAVPFSKNNLVGLNYINFETKYNPLFSNKIKFFVGKCVSAISINNTSVNILDLIGKAEKTPGSGYCNLNNGISIDLSKYAKSGESISFSVESYSFDGEISFSVASSEKDWLIYTAIFLLNIIWIVCLFYIL